MSEGNEEKVEDPVENGEQKGIELPDIILNIPDLIGRPFNNPFEVEVFDKNNNTLNRLDLSLENKLCSFGGNNSSVNFSFIFIFLGF